MKYCIIETIYLWHNAKLYMYSTIHCTPSCQRFLCPPLIVFLSKVYMHTLLVGSLDGWL